MEFKKEDRLDSDNDYLKKLSEEILLTVRRCRNCNYCFPVCPLRISTRGFQTQSPPGILQAIYYAIRWNEFGGEEGKALSEILYSCTTCNSCVLRCKDKSTGTPLLEVIEKGRELLVEKMVGPLKDERKVMESIKLYGNPYQRPRAERMDWLKGEFVKLLPLEKAEVLFFVGCTTSYEPELFSVGRDLIKLWRYFGVDFGLLAEESCCADPIGRLGDKALFDGLANDNKNLFRASGVKSIVTISPHCMNTFIKEYNGLSESLSIAHYTEFLENILKKKEPKFVKSLSYTVTYHDPCYLSKHNGITDPPRNILKMLPGVTLKEMKDFRQNSLCCGAGGGRMYAEVEETDRLANIRVRQALDIGAEVLATACPYCHVMLMNAVRDLGMQEKIKVKDVAELVTEALNI